MTPLARRILVQLYVVGLKHKWDWYWRHFTPLTMDQCSLEVDSDVQKDRLVISIVLFHLYRPRVNACAIVSMFLFSYVCCIQGVSESCHLHLC